MKFRIEQQYELRNDAELNGDALSIPERRRGKHERSVFVFILRKRAWMK